MRPEQKQWFDQHGTAAEKQFVSKYGDSGVSAGGLLTSLMFYVGFAALFFLVVGGYLYVSRASLLRPVTGTWVGTLAQENSGSRSPMLLRSSVSPLHIFRPTLAGSVRLCSAQGEQELTFQQTRTVSADTLGVTLNPRNAPNAGRIFGALRDGELRMLFNGTDRTLEGGLHRGSEAEYQQSCAALRQ